MILTENGVLKLMQRIKSFITAQLNTKAASVHTHNASEITDLSSLQWGGGYSKSEIDTLLNDYIPKSGANDISGSLIPSTDNAYDLGNRTHAFYTINVGTYIQYNSTALRFTSAGNNAGMVLGYSALLPGKDNVYSLGSSTWHWSVVFASSSTIITSDQRKKDNIKQIDDKLLDAWENVNLVQFNFKDALEKKGENARLHTGYIAQNIQQACEEKGVNPNDYGLFCHDEWEEQEEKKDENGQVIEPYKPKGDLYSLRYEEALVVECAYLRRENARLKERLSKIENLLNI